MQTPSPHLTVEDEARRAIFGTFIVAIYVSRVAEPLAVLHEFECEMDMEAR